MTRAHTCDTLITNSHKHWLNIIFTITKPTQPALKGLSTFMAKVSELLHISFFSHLRESLEKLCNVPKNEAFICVVFGLSAWMGFQVLLENYLGAISSRLSVLVALVSLCVLIPAVAASTPSQDPLQYNMSSSTLYSFSVVCTEGGGQEGSRSPPPLVAQMLKNKR